MNKNKLNTKDKKTLLEIVEITREINNRVKLDLIKIVKILKHLEEVQSLTLETLNLEETLRKAKELKKFANSNLVSYERFKDKLKVEELKLCSYCKKQILSRQIAFSFTNSDGTKIEICEDCRTSKNYKK